MKPFGEFVMITLKKVFVASAMSIALLTLANSVLAAEYLKDDFNAGGTAGAKSRGWEFTLNDKVTEVGSDFVIAPEYIAKAPGSDTGFVNPPTVDGTQSDGGYLISDSDSGENSDDIGSQAEIWAISPKFSTVGASQVWFHADADIDANNNGEAIIQLAVTTDNGATWIPVWNCVEPQRPIKGANNNIDGAAFSGGYPVLGSASHTLTFDGIHGRWHLQLPAAAVNKSEVRFRIGFYESADAWWIALDNVLVDDVAPPQGTETVLFEDFKNGIPSTWGNTPLVTQKWDVRPLWFTEGDISEPLKYNDSLGMGINIDLLEEAKSMNYTIDLTKEVDTNLNPNGLLDGRWVLMLAGQGYAMWQEGNTDADNSEGANLDTPALDMTTATGVFMDFDSEMLRGSSTAFYDVFVSVDKGTTFSRIFTYEEALTNAEEAPYFDHHYFSVPSAAGKSGVIFRFSAKGADPNAMNGFWVVDNVRVTANRTTAVPEWYLF